MSKVSLKRCGFAVDFGNRALKGIERLGQVAVLRFQIGLTLTLDLVLVDGGKVNRPQTADTLTNARQLLLPFLGGLSPQAWPSTSFFRLSFLRPDFRSGLGGEYPGPGIPCAPFPARYALWALSSA